MSAHGKARRLLLSILVLSAAVSTAGCDQQKQLRCRLAPGIEPGQVVINEIFFQSSTAADAAPEQRVDFVEIAGPPGTDLSCLDLVGINGNDCSYYNPISLQGHSIPESGVFLIAEAKSEWTLSRHSECPEGEAAYTDPESGERVCGPDPCDPNPCTEPNKGICARSMPEEPTYRCSCNHGYYPDEEGDCLENPIYRRADLVHENAGYRGGPDALVLLDLTDGVSVVDSVTYSDRIECPAVRPITGGPTRPPLPRESIARCTGTAEEYDQFVNTGDDSRDWNSAHPTPGYHNIHVTCPDPCDEPPLPGELIFTEVSPRPFGPQWVELVNATDDRSVSLCNCWLADAVYKDEELSLGSLSTLQWGPAVEPGAHVMLAKSPFDEACPDVPVDYYYGTGANFRVTSPDAAFLVCAPMPGRPMPSGARVWEGEFSGENTGTVEKVYEVARVEFLAAEVERGYSLARYEDGSWGRTWDGPFCTTEDGTDHGSPRRANRDAPPPPLPGDLELTEIAPRPIDSPEWVEFVSHAEHTVALDECYLVDGGVTPHQFSLNFGSAIEAGERYLFAHSRDDPCGLPADFIFSSVTFAVTTPEEAAIVCLPGPNGMPPGAETWELRDGVTAYVVDMVELDASDLPRGYSLAKFSDGSWGRTFDGPYCEVEGGINYGSPGEPNSEPAACPCPGDLVMTEMMSDPDGEGSEWFEIYNAGDESISLHCYSVLSQRWDDTEYTERSRWSFMSLDEPPVLDPGERLVVDKGGCEDLSIDNCVPLEGGFWMYATSEGAFDTVCTDGGGEERLVDRAAYNLPVQPRQTGHSFQLDKRYTDSPEREYWYRWCRGQDVYQTLDDEGVPVSNHGSPGRENHECPDVPSWPAEGDLVITEIMGRSLTHNNRWFEVHNRGAGEVSLDGCTITRISGTGTASRTTLPEEGGAVVPPGGWEVFARPTMPCPGGTSCVQWPSTSLTITEIGTLLIECPRLDDPTGRLQAIVDEVEYDYGHESFEDTATYRRTLSLRPDRLDSRLFPEDWYVAPDSQAYPAFDADGELTETEYGSPGEANPQVDP